MRFGAIDCFGLADPVKGLLKTSLCMGLLVICSLTAQAQNITETHWYFGNSTENFVIDRSGRTASLETNQATPFGTGGSAVIVDQLKGNLLFYSDGQRVYDATHSLVPAVAGGTLLDGDPALNQPVVACPFPDNSDQYYLFTNNGTEVAYSVIDASLQGNGTVPQFPKGDVTTFNQAFGVSNPSEGMTIIESDEGQRFWLLTQDQTSFAFRVTEIDSLGVGATVLYNVFPAGVPGFEAAQFATMQDSLIAVAPKNANRNVLIMNFDNATGELTYNRSVQNTGFADAGPTVTYDVEWSNDASKLYISRTGDDTNSGTLYQVDLADTVNTPIPVNEVLPYSMFRSFGLKRGIDGRIYHLYQLNDASSPFRLGRINRPDSTVADGVLYDSLVFDADFNGQQFPQFAPGYLPPDFFDLSFTHFDSCLNSTTKFTALVDPLPRNYFWDFGDQSGGFGPAPIHTYGAQGSYPVTLTVELNGITQSYTESISIFTADTADLGNDTTICETLTLDPEVDGALGYVWSTGETTPTIDVDSAGTYWVEVTTASGCTTYDDIEITLYGVTSQEYNQWYFGERAGLDFNMGAPVAITDDNIMSSPEGCATVSDQNGDLLFYTNGSTVWNKEHNVMLNGLNIGGDSTAAQSSIILPFTDDNTLFYIFTTEEVYGDFSFNTKMSIVDMKGDTARGEVMVKDVPIIDCSTERITATGFAGTPVLMAHEYGNNVFRAHQISEFGLSGAVFSSAGEIHAFENEPNATGYMKFTPTLDLIATVIPDNPNYVELLDFDVTTGEVSNPRLIDIDEPGTSIYGLEFSASGLKMYVTNGVSLFQFDLDSLNSQDPGADILATKFEIASGTGFGALQTGPDGVIYMAIDGSAFVGGISNPEEEDALVGFNNQQVDINPDGGRLSRLGLPNFTQEVNMSPQQPSISTTIACAGQETQFTGTGRDSSIETYSWDFGDETPPTGFLESPDTTHVYSVPGTYTVTLTLRNHCDPMDSVLMDTIEVFSIPEQPMVPEDTAMCGGGVTLFAWDVDRDDLNYYWSTGDTTRSVTFTSPAVVDVAIINDDGCSSDTLTVFIADNETFIDLGPDRLLCQNDTVVLDANVAGNDFVWTRDGVVVGDQQTQTVNTGSPGTFSYAVAFTNTFTGCVYRDTVELEVQAGPVATQSNVVLPECGMNNGSFQLDIASTGSFSYDLQGPASDGPYTFDGPGTTPPFNNLPSGTYTSRITNIVNGCVRTQVLQLEDNAPFDIEARGLNDCVRTGDISIRFINALPATVTINITNTSGFNVYSATEDLTTRIVQVDDLDSGTYYVEVQDVDPPNCIQTDTVTLSITDECFRRIFVPNAFSPNGNAQNEEFFAFPNQYIDQFEIFIYNRWGDLIYYADDRNFRWDGTFQGSVVSSGTYAYRMLFTSSLEPEAGTLEQFGSVTVVR